MSVLINELRKEAAAFRGTGSEHHAQSLEKMASLLEQPEMAKAAEKSFRQAIAECRGQEDVDAGIIADKQLRVHFDAGLQQLKSLPPSRERSLSVTKIQEAIMWLGMDLKRLNDTRPYPSSYDPSNTKVEPTADGLKL